MEGILSGKALFENLNVLWKRVDCKNLPFKTQVEDLAGPVAIVCADVEENALRADLCDELQEKKLAILLHVGIAIVIVDLHHSASDLRRVIAMRENAGDRI
jgi:hypothetical protein